jgi:hypothetical protein
MDHLSIPRQTSATIRLLFIANWLLLGVTWVISLYGYGRLPQKVSSWSSLWKNDQLRVERSLAFFIYPISQLIFFLALLILARIFFVKAPESGMDSLPSDKQKTMRMLELKKEIVYLALIFINLIFIHLQSSLILLSRQVGTGINTYYLSVLIGILFILIPYYHIRRKMILKERA